MAIFEGIEFPKKAAAPSAADLELAAHIGREFALSVPGSDRHAMLGAWFKLMNAEARKAAHAAYDAALCSH